jgi:hypothetical protein
MDEGRDIENSWLLPTWRALPLACRSNEEND